MDEQPDADLPKGDKRPDPFKPFKPFKSLEEMVKSVSYDVEPDDLDLDLEEDEDDE